MSEKERERENYVQLAGKSLQGDATSNAQLLQWCSTSSAPPSLASAFLAPISPLFIASALILLPGAAVGSLHHTHTHTHPFGAPCEHDAKHDANYSQLPSFLSSLSLSLQTAPVQVQRSKRFADGN